MTPYSDVDDMFLNDILDNTYLSFDVEDKESILNMLRVKAVTMFKSCKKDLSDKDDNLKQYNQLLTDEEKLIIATAMKKFWLNDKIYDVSLLKQKMSTKDWKLTSQAEHLNRLIGLKKDLDNEISEMIVSYTFYAYTLKEV